MLHVNAFTGENFAIIFGSGGGILSYRSPARWRSKIQCHPCGALLQVKIDSRGMQGALTTVNERIIFFQGFLVKNP